MTRRSFLSALLGAPLWPENRPNIVLIVADDLGFGDLSCYGGKVLTPNIDRLASSGMRFTCHESAAPVCSASRTSLLTGRHAQRLGIDPLNWVVFPETKEGLPPVQTMADSLRYAGYHTGMVGKWHLGHNNPEFHPTKRGLNFFRGIPYSNDMSPNCYDSGQGYVEFPDSERSGLTNRFTADALEFLQSAQNQQSPFFLYLALTAPHVPLEPSEEFIGRSGFGLYGDMLLELDNSVKRIVSALGSNTLVLFTSDNGADLDQPETERGSNGNLKSGKFAVDEGGVRVPFIACWPGRISAGSVYNGLTSALDIAPTLCTLAGYSADDPHRGETDGVDLSALMLGTALEVPRAKPLLYFRYNDPECLAFLLGSQIIKVRFARDGQRLLRPEANNISALADPGETTDIYSELPADVVASAMQMARSELSAFPNNINKVLL